MAQTSTRSGSTRRGSLVVGLFLSAYGLYHLLNGHTGDDLVGLGALLFGVGLFLGVAAERAADARAGRGFRVGSWAAIAAGVVAAAADLLGLGS